MPDASPEEVTRLSALVDARAAKETAPVEKQDEPKGGNAKDEKAVEDAGKVASQPEAQADEAKKAPAKVQARDYSWSPEHLRSKWEVLDDEAFAAVRDSWMLKADHTRKTQKLAEAEKEFEKRKAAAERWERLEQTPEAAAAADRVLRGEKPQVADDDVPDALLSKEDVRAFRERVRQEARADAERLVDEKLKVAVVEPQQRAEGILIALNDFASDRGVDKPTMESAILSAKEHAKSLGIDWTPQNAVALVQPFIPASPPRKNGSASEQPAGNEKGWPAKVASPNGRGTSVLPPSETPAAIREKRGPKGRAESMDLALHALRETFGRDATATDLHDLLSR